MKKYMIVATLDDRTCPICIEKNGTYTDKDDIVPFHPNCRCILVKTDESLTLDDYIEACKEIKKDKELYKNFIKVVDKEIIKKVDYLYEIYKNGEYKNLDKNIKLNDIDLSILKTLSMKKFKNKKWLLLFLILYKENEEKNKGNTR